jgi:hypothetical protein
MTVGAERAAARRHEESGSATLPVEMEASDSYDALEQALSGRAREQPGFRHGDTLRQHRRLASLWCGRGVWQCRPGQPIQAWRVVL